MSAPVVPASRVDACTGLAYLFACGAHPVGVPSRHVGSPGHADPEYRRDAGRGLFVSLAGRGLLLVTRLESRVHAEIFDRRGDGGWRPWGPAVELLGGDRVVWNFCWNHMDGCGLGWPPARDAFLAYLGERPKLAPRLRLLRGGPPPPAPVAGWQLVCPAAHCRAVLECGETLADSLCPAAVFCRTHPFRYTSGGRYLTHQEHGGGDLHPVPPLTLAHAATGVCLDVSVFDEAVAGVRADRHSGIAVRILPHYCPHGHGRNRTVLLRRADRSPLLGIAAGVCARRSDWPVLLDALTEHAQVGDLLEAAFLAARAAPVMTPGGW